MPKGFWGYAALSIIMIIISCGVFYYLFENADRYASQTNHRFYYFLLIIIGLAASFGLFGAIKSRATISGNNFGTTWEAGGPAALFIIVVTGGMYLTRGPDLFDLTIQLRSDGAVSEVAEDASIVLFLGTRPRVGEFDSLGATTITEVPAKYKGEEVRLEFRSKRFRTIDSGPKKIPEEGPLIVQVELDEESLKKAEREKIVDELSNILQLVNQSISDKGELIRKIKIFLNLHTQNSWNEVLRAARRDIETIEIGMAAIENYDRKFFEIDGSVVSIAAGSVGEIVDRKYYKMNEVVRRHWDAKLQKNRIFTTHERVETLPNDQQVRDWLSALEFTYNALGRQIKEMIEQIKMS